MNCSDCAHPAAVLHGDTPLCGACFYKRSVVEAEPAGPDASPRDEEMWHRLAEAISALETIASRIASEMNELVKNRKDQQE